MAVQEREVAIECLDLITTLIQPARPEASKSEYALSIGGSSIALSAPESVRLHWIHRGWTPPGEADAVQEGGNGPSGHHQAVDQSPRLVSCMRFAASLRARKVNNMEMYIAAAKPIPTAIRLPKGAPLAMDVGPARDAAGDYRREDRGDKGMA